MFDNRCCWWLRLTAVLLCSTLQIHLCQAGCIIDQTKNVDENQPAGTIITWTESKSLRIDRCRDDPLYNQQLVAIKIKEGNWSVQINKEFDAETMPNPMTFDLTCIDTDDTALSLDLTVIINDVDEFPPEFSKPIYEIHIPEDTPVDSIVFSFTQLAKDKDFSSIATSIQYILNSDANGAFVINDHYNGAVQLEKNLDFESGNIIYTLNVSAQDVNNHLMESTALLKIWVTDVDDLNPVFDQNIYNLQIQEGTYTGSELFRPNPTLSARDGDTAINQTIYFSLDLSSKAQYNSLFDISKNGSLALNGTVKPGKYSINVRAYQVDKPSFRYAVAILVLTVTDINNNKPVLSSSHYSADVSELSPLGTTVLTVSASDLDEGDNAVFKFFLQSDVSSSGVFDVITDQTLGYIILNQTLDREQKASYTFQVYAKEIKTQERFESSHSNVTIKVLDENDNSPIFNASYYSFRINRTATGVIGQVLATDADSGPNGVIVYSLQNSYFTSAVAIDSKTGRISLTRNLLRSDVGTYSIITVATDSSIDVTKRRSSLAAVVIQVSPVNDNAPSFVGSQPYIFNVPETTSANSLIGQISAVDSDGDSIEYFIKSGNEDNYVRLDSSSGQLYLIKENDLDATSVVTSYLALNASASDGLYNTTTEVHLQFTYVNEFDPVFTSVPVGTVAENSRKGANITKVVATDKDIDGVLTYSLVPLSYSSIFSIDPQTGWISLACDTCLNYDTRTSYDIVVKVEDGGNPSRQSLTSVTINVTKTAFAKPHFVQKMFFFQVLENSVNYFQLDATDPDTPRTQLAFSIAAPYKPDAGVAFFVNVINNGTVGISAIDAEKYSSITFGVNVTDGINMDTAVVFINVTDVNDNDPVLVMQSPVNVLENAQSGQNVLTVSASDKDISNSGFTYYIETGTDGKFQIHPSSGVITTAGQFDRRQKSVYNFSVNVLDHGSPPRLASQFLVVNIVDSNTAPVFVNSLTTRLPVAEYNFTVPEDTSVGSHIGHLYAYDPDFGSSGQLKYDITFQDPKDFFSLGSADGQLTLNKMLNYEIKNKYQLIAIVSDNSYQPKTATATVDISVQNIIEAPEWPLPLPVIYFTQTSTCSPQLQALSQEVTTLSSRGDEFVEYKLLNHTNLFRINSSTGDLQVINSLTTGTYFVGLTACANGTTVCSNASLIVVVSTGDSLMFCPAFVNIMVNESLYSNKLLQDLDTNKGDSGVQYSITSGNSDKNFWINSTDGKLYVNGILDRETTHQYMLTVTATQATSKETAQAQVIINVLDLPDTAPVFQLNLYSGEISESDNVGGPVKLPESSIPLRVQATDQDLNPVLIYSIDPASDTSSGSFSVDSSTGAIYLAKKIDFETMPKNLNRTYSFIVTVSDGVFNATTQVQVKILDANDNAPIFVDSSPTVISVQEDTKPIKVLGTVIATDADSIDYGKLVYKITSIYPSGRGNPFKIEAETGNIVLEDSLDRETIENYVLFIIVEDLAGHTATKEVHINVLDVNDNGPYFLNTTYFMNVTEDRGLKISATPGEILIGKTQYLLVNCSFSHPPSKTSHLASLVLYSSTAGSPTREILSANTFTPETVAKYVDLQSGFVYKSMHDDVSMTSFIALLMMYPSQENTFYICDAHTLDASDMPEKFTTGIEVISKGQLSISELLKELQALGNKLFSLASNGSVTQDEHCVKASEHAIEENTMYREMLYHISDSYQNTRFYLSKASDCGNSFMAASKANQMCETMGGQLARIENAQQYAFIQNFLKSKINFETSVLVSGHDEDRHDRWVYHGSDQPLPFFDWGPSEPEGHSLGGRHCIVMGWSGFDLKMMTNHCAENSVTRYTTYLCAVQNEGVGTKILLEAVDKDKDNSTNAEITYSIVSGNGEKYFKLMIFEDKWHFKTIKALDREELVKRGSTTLQVIVKAEDIVPVLNGPSSSTCTVMVTVLDINDNWPVFSNEAYSGQVLETAVDDTPIPLVPPVAVNDPDFGDNGTDGVVFSLKSESTFFRINKTTGQLYVSLNGNHLDRETKDVYTMEIIAADKFGAGKSSSANVTITILDVNDEKPEFNQSSYSFTVSEKEQVDAVVGYVYAKDKDRGTTLYYLKGSSSFVILPLDGKIIVSGYLDRRVQKSFLLNVSACDVELPEGCNSVNVTINVTDTNDHCPVWNTSSLYMSVSEANKPFDVVGHLVAVDEDDDNGVLTYFTNDTAVKSFINVTDTGDVKLLQVIENSQTFKFPVFARDGGNPACTQRADIEIKVDGVNKHDPVICNNNICGVAVVNMSVLDNAKAGSVIGYITSYDNDTGINGQTHFYFSDNPFINITNSGFITLKKDIVKSEVFPEFIVWVVDSGFAPRNSSTVLHIIIEPSLSVRPVFTKISYTFSVPENSAFYGDVRANQSDGKSVNYSLVAGEDGLPFNIFNNGTIHNIKNLDRETEERYEFIVSAFVANNIDMYTWALVRVLVTDVNDNPPVFDDSEMTVTVLENTNQTLTQLLATDADEGSNRNVTYYLTDPANYPQFSINAETGVLSVVMPLDREKQASYTLYIVARDGGTPSNSATATVQVLVADVNDNPPIFSQPSYVFNIKSFGNISQILYPVSATDADEGANQVIVYTLEEVPDDSKFFYIDPLTGVLSTVQRLSKPFYTLRVKASDLGSPSLFSLANVTFNVLDSDIKPTLTVQPDSITLYVGMLQGTILEVTVNYSNAQLINISEGNENQVFKFVNKKIILAQDLTRPMNYNLSILASNRPVTEQTTSVILKVFVRSVEFDQLNYLASVPENYKNLPKILCQLRSAAQMQVNVSYKLNNFNDLFQLASGTGQLSVVKLLDREMTSVYILNVSVTVSSAGQAAQGRKKRQASSGGGGYASVIVQVEDENDNAPTFGSGRSNLYFNVPASAVSDSVVAQIQAFDPDEGLNGLIFYKIENGNVEEFKLNSQNGELTVKNSTGFSSKPQWDLTISATDRNGTGNVARVNVTIYVQNMSSYTLQAAVPLSLFKDNQQSILEKLGNILGFKVNFINASVIKDSSCVITFSALDLKSNATVSTDEIGKKVQDKLADITELFNSYLKTGKSSSNTDEGAYNTTSIVLIVIGCVMFVASLLAILVAYLMWKKQRHYAEKEENAARVREKLGEQMTHKASNASSDPDEHLEMDIDLDDSQMFSPELFLQFAKESERETKVDVEEQESVIAFKTEFKSDISTVALRHSLVDMKTQHMQQLFQSISEEEDLGSSQRPVETRTGSNGNTRFSSLDSGDRESNIYTNISLSGRNDELLYKQDEDVYTVLRKNVTNNETQIKEGGIQSVDDKLEDSEPDYQEIPSIVNSVTSPADIHSEFSRLQEADGLNNAASGVKDDHLSSGKPDVTDGVADEHLSNAEKNDLEHPPSVSDESDTSSDEEITYF